MKRSTLFFIFLVFVFLLSLLPHDAFAKVATESQQTRREEIRQKIEEKRQEILERRETIRQRIEEKKASTAAKLQETRKQRIRAFWQKLNERLIAVIGRLEKLIDRIESRLAKIEGENEELKVEIAEIEQQLDVARESLEDTEIEIQAATESVELVLSSENPKEAFAEVRDIIMEAKNNLVEVHRLLVHVIGDIKGLRVGLTEGETGTDEATQSANP